jgi:hypothetical protein
MSKYKIALKIIAFIGLILAIFSAYNDNGEAETVISFIVSAMILNLLADLQELKK